MKKNRTRLLSLILAAVMLSLSACGEGTNNEKENENTETSNLADAEETIIPEETQKTIAFASEDNGGKEFNILTTVHAEYEYVADELTGEIVNDAVYNRNLEVDNYLGIKMNFIVEPGHWADRNTFNALITNSVMAQDGAYDLINGVTVCVLPITINNVFINANDLSYINLDNPWWVQGMNESLAIKGKLFGIIGDASLSMYKDLSVMYVNQKVANDLGCDSFYEIVKSGKWTLDRFMEVCESASIDMNGDGVYRGGDDLIGFSTIQVPQRAFQTSTEFKVINKDEEGNPYFIDLRERDVALYDKIYSFMSIDKNKYYAGNSLEAVNAFTSDKSLIMLNFLNATEGLREMESDFGIIPLPKADESQANYHSQIGTSTSMFFIPLTVQNVDLTSKVCEALCFYSTDSVVPGYYEIALKEKYSRDSEVQEMLDIIRESAQMDFTYAYSTMFDPFINIFTEIGTWYDLKDNLTSYYAKYRPKWEGVLDNLLKGYDGLQ